MCFDHANATWSDHSRKHQTPPQFRDASERDVDQMTDRRPALYYPSVSQRELEESVLAEGQYVHTGKRATVCKVLEFGHFIGASDGMPSRWVMVEITSGVFHGRPISEALYRAKMRRPLICCKDA